MVTRQDAEQATEFHFTGRHNCTRTIGPRGGVTEQVTRARANGSVKTWKRDPERFYVGVKHGLYTYGHIDNGNAQYWHTAADCPLAREDSGRRALNACVECHVSHTPAEALRLHPVGTMPGDRRVVRAA